jgi:carbonic anhydrase
VDNSLEWRIFHDPRRNDRRYSPPRRRRGRRAIKPSFAAFSPEGLNLEEAHMHDAASRTALLPEALVEGYEGFLTGKFPRERQRFQDLATIGQRPQTPIIGCCDSRVTPEEIFNVEPGELFDVRNVANLVPPCSADNYHHDSWAAIDYAITALRVKHIVVLGHAKCGGVRAFVESHAGVAEPALENDDYLGDWIRLIAPAARRLGQVPAAFDASYAQRLGLESVKQGLRNLRTFPKVAALERVEALKLHGAFFEIEDARLLALDEAGDEFVQIAAPAHEATIAQARF